MSKKPDDITKQLLTDLAEMVNHLPEHLQAVAFSVLLQKVNIPTGGRSGKGSAIPPPGEGTTFAEYFHSFPANIKEAEKLLVAASFAETQTEGRTFSIEAAHLLLKDLGVELSNAGVFAKQLVSKKWVITISKQGKKTFNYRVSLQGHNLLKAIRENVE